MDMGKLKADFESGIKYDELADKYGISKGTISKYKKKYNWKRNNGNEATKQRKQNKKVSSKVSNVQLSNQQSTNDRWKQFCFQYLQCYNATQAYMSVYDCDYNTAMVNGSTLLRNTKVKSYLDELRAEQSNELYVSVKDILKQELKIAYGNIGDYLTVKTIKQERLDADGHPVVDVDGQPIIDEYNRFVVTDPDKLDWSIVQEAHTGKDGLVVKLYDKHKALSELLKRLPDADEARIAKSKADILDTDNDNTMTQVDKLINMINDADDEGDE